MSSVICQNFVQNAWKKELCSNCFKSKDEHNLSEKSKKSALNLNKNIKGIIRTNEKFRPKRSVCFKSELSKVIGFGGEDWASDTEDETNAGDQSFEDEDFEIEEEDEEDDERELQKLTKANTDFNTNSLNDLNEIKKSYTQLMLGKPQLDADGRKQTLLVSVTPFGQENLSPPNRKYSKPISHIPIAKNKDTLVEAKSNVILTAYSKNNNENSNKEEKSLLDEISETLENSKNPIQIISRKKIQKDIILTVSKTENNKENLDGCENNNNGEINTEKEKDNKINKSSIPERKNGLSRTPVIMKRDQEKPVIYQTSTAKIELLNTKNLKFNTSKENLANKLIKSELKIDKVDLKDKEDDKKKSVGNENMKFIKDEIILNSNEKQNKELENKEKSVTLVERNVEGSQEFNQNKMKMAELSQVPKYQNMLFTQSREQAGEPDGRADPDIISEPPALPLTPPPNLETQASFLHSSNQIYDKPKVPTKPATVLIRKSVVPANNHVETHNHVLTTFIVDPKISDEKVDLSKHDPNSSEVTRISNNNKRKAPKPPHVDENGTIYTRNSSNSMNLDSPVVREKEKRERASSCSPKIRNIVNENPQGESESNYASLVPEPAPRRSLSLSTDSLAVSYNEEKRKEKTKGRFSLKKFLRMGSSKDTQKIQSEVAKNDDNDYAPQPKPRLVIVHPLDLNGAKVEVVTKPVINQDQIDQTNDVRNHIEQERYAQRQATKPPPPPRNLNEWNRPGKPNLPHPPKSADIVNRQKQFTRAFNNNNKRTDSVYANIGEVRSAITPNKPQRTASMREREAQQQRKAVENYEILNVHDKESGENVYDYINSARSSSPECDSSPDKNSPTPKNGRLQNGLAKQRSESTVDVSGDYFKYQNIPRSMSLTYCGSETESEIYSPYSFYGSESEITEDDHDWATPSSRTHKLRSRKGRSIVHKNLEDNYGAVIVANHEALAQVLENIQQTTSIQPALRGLKTASNLCWTDFSIKSTIAPIIVGPKAFHQALWGVQHVTLVISAGSVPTSPLSLGTFNLVPITEFSDLIPAKYLVSTDDSGKNIQATVAVFPWMQVNTIQSFGESIRNKALQNHEDTWKDVSFILLQLVNALKTLQAQGIEELQLSLNSFVLCRDMERDSHFRLSVLQGLGEDITHKEEERYGSLCMCASKALTELLPTTSKITPLIQSLLNTERAVSLTQVKSILEFTLWGPSDVALGSTIRERELALQRWLDLQRATVLHGLVCTRIQLTVYEESHLLFLVRSNARMMCDASLLLESSNMQHAHSNK